MISRGWYAVGGVLAAVGIVGAVVLGLLAVSLAKDAAITRLPDDATITLTDERFAVWARADVPSDATGADLGVRCVVMPQGGAPVGVPPLQNQSAHINGWHLVALSSPDSLDGWDGTPALLTCTADDDRLAGATWGTGAAPHVLGVIGLAIAAFVVGVGGVVLGALATLVVWLVRRRRATA